MYLSLISSCFKLINVLARKAQEKQLMDAGASQSLVKHANEGLNKINKAIAARRSVKHSAGSMSNDTANRNRR